MNIVDEPAGRPQHDEVAVAFPKAQDRIASALIEFFEQGEVQGEILDRGGQGQIQQAEGMHGVTASRSSRGKDGWAGHGTLRPLP